MKTAKPHSATINVFRFIQKPLSPQAIFALCMLLAVRHVTAQTTWIGADLVNNNTNWSDSANWSSGVVPGSGDAVVFNSTGASTNQGAVNNIVDLGFTSPIASLSYSNTNGLYVTTEIPDGQTLTVSGTTLVGLANGSTTIAAMAGGGTFEDDGAVSVAQAASSGTGTATLNLSGLNLFSNNVSTATLAIGSVQQVNANLLLATNNFIDVSAISLEATGGKNGRVGYLYLGSGTNILQANTIQVGEGKFQHATVQFNSSAPATAGVSITGTGGTNRSTITLGYDHSGSAYGDGNLLLAGHPANVLAGTLTLGRKGNTATGADTGTVTFDNGIFDVTTIIMGEVGGGSSTIGAQGTFTVGGDPVNRATLIVNSPNGPGSGSFIIGDSTAAGYSGVGDLIINTNGVADIYCDITKYNSADNTAIISVNGGGLNMEDNNLGAAGTPVDELNVTNATLTLAASASGGANVVAINADGVNTVNLSSIKIIGSYSYPFEFPVISYSTLNGFNFTLGSLPGTFQGYLTNTGTSVDVVITNGPPPPRTLTWSGLDPDNGNAVTSTWDDGVTRDWLSNSTPVAYNDNGVNGGDAVTLDDNGATGTLTLAATLSPTAVIASNNVLNYTINDNNAGYALAGKGSLVKEGSGTLVLDNAGGVTLSGGVAVEDGTLQVGNNDANGTISGDIVDNSALAFRRNDSLIVSNNISGSGAVVINDGTGTLTLAGNNTFNGAVTVASGGTLQAGSNSALGTTNGSTTINSGAVLDVNGQNLGAETVIVSGSGTGSGAIINNSATAADNALQYVTLAGDTTLGANSSRWDIRGSNIHTSDTAALSTEGNAFNLTKVGANQLSLVGVAVDTNLANVDVQQGTFSLQEATTGLGNPAGTLTIESGATLDFYALTNELDKNIVLVGGGGYSILNESGANAIVGPITENGDCSINVDGTSLAINGSLTGGQLTKDGSGVLIINGNASNSGTTVNLGGLTLNGTHTGTITVGNPYIPVPFSGTGTNSGSTDVYGPVFPGDTNVVGTITLDGLTLESSAVLYFDLGRTNTVGGTANDLIQVDGDLTINGNSVVINPMGILQKGVPYRLINYTGNLTWNSDLSFSAPDNYTFTVDTNTPGEINIIVSGGGPVWNGGSTTDSDWTDANNWGGVASPQSGDLLYFTGTNRLNNTNDTADDTSYGGIGFGASAGRFILNGNTVALNGNISNSSTNTQTVNLSLDLSGNRTFDGGNGKIIIAGLTNSSGLTSLTLAGSGVLTNNLGIQSTLWTNILDSTNANWTFLDNASSAAITNPVAFDLSAGTLTFGAGNSAPVLTSTTSAFNFTLGVSDSEPATFNMVNGTFTLPVRFNMGEGSGAISTFNMSGGTVTATLFQGADAYSNTVSTVNVSGGTFNIETTSLQSFFLCSRGTGTLTVSGTGQINCGTLDLSRNASSDGTTGLVNLNGGILDVQKVSTGTSATGSGGTPTATFNFNGGILRAQESQTHFFQGRQSSPAIPIMSYVQAGGAIIDSAGFNIGMDEPLQHDSVLGGTADGGLIKLGDGTLTLTASNSYTGSTTISNGTLQVDGDISGAGVDVVGGALAGAGSIAAPVTVEMNGTLAPGDSAIGTLNISGSLTVAGTNQMDLNKNAGVLTSDLITNVTTLSLGGTLQLNVTGDALANGDSFTLYSAGNITGSFDNIVPATPGPGLVWDTSALDSQGILQVKGNGIIKPAIGGVSVSGGNMMFTVTGGITNGTVIVLTSTNVALSLTNWTPILTNQFDSNGDFNFTNSSAQPQQFFIIREQ